jgi:hypothetical protein
LPFPYLGGSVSVDQLRSVVMAYEGVIVPGRQGAKLAAKAPGVLIDPAVYAPQARTEPETLARHQLVAAGPQPAPGCRPPAGTAVVVRLGRAGS